MKDSNHKHNSKHDRRSSSGSTEHSESDHHDHSDHKGHDKHAGHSVEMFRARFWVCLFLTIPALFWEPMLQEWFGYEAPVFPGSDFIPAFFGTIVFFYGGWIFIKGAFREISNRLPGMMTLISLAICVAFVYSIAVTLGFDGHAIWWELSTLVTIMLLGHWIEMRSIFQAQGALQELAKLLPDTAVKISEDGATTEVKVEDLQEGDLILIRPGSSIPADGIVQSGKSSTNESMITGESRLIEKKESDPVIAGTVNGEGSLRVRVTETGEKTALAGIMRLVEQAQKSRSRSQDLADRAAYFLTLVAIGAGVLTFIVWLLIGASLDFTISRVVTVLVIACPHALGLAFPLVIAISTTLGARNGLLVRDRRGLEKSRNLDVIVFDKTGTLTLGEHRVVEVVTGKEIETNEALRLASAVERDSEHPTALAFLASSKEKGIEVPSSKDFQAIPGQGVKAQVEGREIHVGGPALLEKKNINPGQKLIQAAEKFGSSGQTAIYLVENQEALAVFAVADAVRPESEEAIKKLHKMGLEVAMLTGDSEAVAQAVGKKLNIDHIFSQVLPENKAEKIKELQSQKKNVAMVGDGVNDAPALVAADVGIAIGAGTDVAVEAGDIVLVRSDPRDVSRIVNLSRASYRKMIQNLWWAAGYNIIAIPLAAGVLAWAGIILVPAVGAILMSASTVIVAINAQLLRRIEL